MSSPVTIEHRAARPFVGISGSVTIPQIPAFYAHLGTLQQWIHSAKLQMAGPPFMDYRVIDMAATLEVVLGWPVASIDGVKAPREKTEDGKGRYVTGNLPEGEYACLAYTGHPSQLIKANAELQDWAKTQGDKVTFDMKHGPKGEEWACRLEISVTDPSQEPDMSKWTTLLEYKLK